MPSALWLLLIWMQALPGSGDARSVIRLFETRYNSAHTLRAVFFERYSEGRKSIQVESGSVLFRKPGKMRWEYEAPERKLFLSDGKFVWFFVPGDRTVTRAKIRESEDWRTPLALLAGKTKLSRLFERIELAPTDSGIPARHAVLICSPRSAGKAAQTRGQGESALATGGRDPERVLLEVDRDTGLVSRILIEWSAGVELEFRFAQWQLNPELDDSLFRFRPPVGIAIVDGDATDPKLPAAR